MIARKLNKRSTSPLASQIKQHTVVLPAFPYAVLPNHHTAVTKLEQHEKLVKYDRKVVHFIPDKLHVFEKQCQVIQFVQCVVQYIWPIIMWNGIHGLAILKLCI